MSYRRKSGMRRIHKIAKVSGTALAELELVKKNGTSNNVTAWTSGAALLGIAMEAGASSSTAAIDVDVIAPGELIEGDVGSGTPASGDFKSCDGNSTGATVGTDSNHDFLYMYAGSSTVVDLYPKKLEIATVVS